MKILKSLKFKYLIIKNVLTKVLIFLLFLKKVNPYLQLYCVCVEFIDFYVIDLGNNKSILFKTQKTLCFITYYPFFTLFQ
jgi:hypothetical protein